MPSEPALRRRSPAAVDFTQPAGAPSLVAPDSVHWRIYKNEVALAVGGVAAVLLEFADPRIRSGVWDHSTYKVDPVGRSERTGQAAMMGVYGPRDDAEQLIARVTRMHARVEGDTPDGRHYRALDPELLDWVAATAGYGFLEAYHRFVAPVTPADRDRYWADGHPVAALYGAAGLPDDDAGFAAMLAAISVNFEPHPIVHEFLDIVQSKRTGATVPKFVKRALVHGAVSLLPPDVRATLELGPEYDLTRVDRATLRTLATLGERRVKRDSPAAQAAVRLGLPANFAWLSADEQREHLATAAA